MKALATIVLVAACHAPETAITDQDSVIVFPFVHDFGTVQVGSQAGPIAITVDPDAGANDDLVTAVTANCSNFTIDAQGLPAEVFRTCSVITCAQNCFAPMPQPCMTEDSASYTFYASFHPTIVQPVSCVVTITTNTTTTRTITLTGAGSVPPVDIDVTPTAINFGDVRRATTSTSVALAVKNLGGGTLTVSSAAVSAGYAIASGPAGSYTVGAGGTQPYALTCSPSTLGATPGTFTITSDDPATPTVTVPLACNGIDSTIDLTPSPAVLPTTRVGEPVQTAISITNSGTASSTLQSVVVTGDIALVSAPGAGTVLAPSSSVPVTVGFTAAAAGTASGMLQVTYDGGLVRTTQITAQALATSMSLAPDGEVDFGPVCVGQHAQTAFAIVASDPGAFTVASIAAPDAPFTATLPTLPAALAGNGGTSLAFTVTAAPEREGDATSTLAIATDIPNAPPHTVTLLVTGLGAGVTPTPAAVDFGSHALDTTTLARRVTLSNCSLAAITTTNAHIAGPDASEMSIVAQPDASLVQPAGTASWLVVMSPRTTGLKHASFVIDYDGGSATVELDGEGLGAAAGGPDLGPASYYACSTGRASAWWPVALVVFRMRRRARSRRRSATPSA